MKKPLQALFIQPTEKHAETLANLLGDAGFKTEHSFVCCGRDLDSVIGWPWDVVIANPETADCALEDLLVRLAVRTDSPPVVVVADSGGLYDGVSAMRLGAVDYLLWEDRDRLPDVVAMAVEEARARSAAVGEQRFRQFAQFSVENAVEAIFWLDSLGRFFFANDAAGEMLGYTPRELVTMTVFDVDPALTHENWPRFWDDIKNAGSVVQETQVLTRDGKLIPVEAWGNHLELDGREYLTSSLRDMTSRQRVERALAAEESRYRSLFEDCPISLWEEDLSDVKLYFDELRAQGIEDFATHFSENPDSVFECVKRVKIINVNKATVDLLEAGTKEQLYAGLDKVFTEDSLRVAQEEFTILAKGEFSYSGELDHRTMSGRIIRVAVHFNVAPEYRDTLGRVVVSLLDVTNIRNMQKELEQARDDLERRVEKRTKALAKANEKLLLEIAEREQVERRLRVLVDSLPVLVHAHDEENRFVFWNRESERVLGYTAEDVASRDDIRDDLYPDRERMEAILRWHDERNTSTFEVDMLNRDGDVRTIRWSIMSEESPIQGWATWEAGIDMTDVRKAEARVHSLTHELLRAQESERRRIALELHDNVAQNLSSLKIGCETLFDDEAVVSESVRKKSATLAGSLQACIESVRNMSYDLRPPGLDQLGLVRALEQFSEEQTREWGIPVALTAAGMESLSLGNDIEINIYRLVQEAVRNAARHSGASRVFIKLVASSPDILLRVEDDGRGFDLAARRVVVQGERRMGLQSMEERARLMGGEFSITSVVDKGTKIFVKIPCGEK